MQHAPLIYQEFNGSKHYISGSYVKLGKNQFGFKLNGKYDHSNLLVIDPVLGYATYLAGGDFSAGAAIAIDGAGNAYTINNSGFGFPPTTGSYQAPNTGNGEVYISKLNTDGTALVYSAYIGGSDADYGSGIAIDSDNNAYISGYTASTDFPVSANALQPTFSGGINDPTHNIKATDAFVAKLSPNGDQLLYSSYLGATDGNDLASGIALDSSHNIYLTGYTTSRNFTTTSGVVHSTFGGGH